MQKSPENHVDKSTARIRSLFADIAPRYDFLNRLLSFRRDVAWRRRAVRELRPGPGDLVLDLCTGTADLALELAAHVDATKQGRVVGADFVPEMLRIAAAKRARRQAESLLLVAADALRLPFAEGTFDAVTVAFGIRNVADLRGGLLEMHRVLRPGGQAAILEFSLPGPAWFRSVFRVYFQRILPRIGGCVSGARSGRDAYTYLPRSVDEFPSPERFSELLEACGFQSVRHVPLTLGVAVLHLARRPPKPREVSQAAVVAKEGR